MTYYYLTCAISSDIRYENSPCDNPFPYHMDFVGSHGFCHHEYSWAHINPYLEIINLHLLLPDAM